MDYYANACRLIPADILAEIEHRRDHPPRPWYRRVGGLWVSLRTPRPSEIEMMGKVFTSSLNAALGVRE